MRALRAPTATCRAAHTACPQVRRHRWLRSVHRHHSGHRWCCPDRSSAHRRLAQRRPGENQQRPPHPAVANSRHHEADVARGHRPPRAAPRGRRGRHHPSIQTFRLLRHRCVENPGVHVLVIYSRTDAVFRDIPTWVCSFTRVKPTAALSVREGVARVGCCWLLIADRNAAINDAGRTAMARWSGHWQPTHSNPARDERHGTAAEAPHSNARTALGPRPDETLHPLTTSESCRLAAARPGDDEGEIWADKCAHRARRMHSPATTTVVPDH